MVAIFTHPLGDLIPPTMLVSPSISYKQSPPRKGLQEEKKEESSGAFSIESLLPEDDAVIWSSDSVRMEMNMWDILYAENIDFLFAKWQH